MTFEPTDASPYAVEISLEREGQPVDFCTGHTDAEEAASLVSAYPGLTEPIDPEHGLWNVWLPEYMTRFAWSDGLDLDVRTGGYRIRLDLDPA